jgi:cell wall-associated NlpC family hydrolase
MENSAAKGLGVSCHFLAAAIYKTTGALPEDFTPPKGSIKRLRTSPALAMLHFVDEFLGDRFSVVEVGSSLMPGDLLVGAEKGDDRARHVGIVLKGKQFVHVMRYSGVMISPIADATFSAAQRALGDDRHLFELSGVIAAYNMVSRILVAVGVRATD